MVDKETFKRNIPTKQVLKEKTDIEEWTKNIRKILPIEVTQLYLDFLTHFKENYKVPNEDIEILNSHHKEIILTSCKLYEAFLLKKYNSKESNPFTINCLLATCFWISCKFHTSIPIPGLAIATVMNTEAKDIYKAELDVLFFLRFNLLKYSYD